MKRNKRPESISIEWLDGLSESERLELGWVDPWDVEGCDRDLLRERNRRAIDGDWPDDDVPDESVIRDQILAVGADAVRKRELAALRYVQAAAYLISEFWSVAASVTLGDPSILSNETASECLDALRSAYARSDELGQRVLCEYILDQFDIGEQVEQGPFSTALSREQLDFLRAVQARYLDENPPTADAVRSFVLPRYASLPAPAVILRAAEREAAVLVAHNTAGRGLLYLPVCQMYWLGAASPGLDWADGQLSPSLFVAWAAAARRWVDHVATVWGAARLRLIQDALAEGRSGKANNAGGALVRRMLSEQALAGSVSSSSADAVSPPLSVTDLLDANACYAATIAEQASSGLDDQQPDAAPAISRLVAVPQSLPRAAALVREHLQASPSTALALASALATTCLNLPLAAIAERARQVASAQLPWPTSAAFVAAGTYGACFLELLDGAKTAVELDEAMPLADQSRSWLDELLHRGGFHSLHGVMQKSERDYRKLVAFGSERGSDGHELLRALFQDGEPFPRALDWVLDPSLYLHAIGRAAGPPILSGGQLCVPARASATADAPSRPPVGLERWCEDIVRLGTGD